MIETDEPNDRAGVATPEDDSLPSVDPERYGTFETRDGETILYDTDERGGWIRADYSVTLGR